jgi:glutathione S-transferase
MNSAPSAWSTNVQQSPGYKARNPQGFVPMLEIGEERVTQSLAILDRLDALVEEPPFVPADPAAALMFSHWP